MFIKGTVECSSKEPITQNTLFSSECHSDCTGNQCCTRAEYFQMSSEDDIVHLYHQVKTNNCSVTDQATEGAEAVAKRTSESFQALIGPFGARVPPSIAFKKRLSAGIFAEHIFVALDKMSCYHTALDTRHPKSVPSTWFHSLQPIHTMIEHKRYKLLTTSVYKNNWILGLIPRRIMTSFSGSSVNSLMHHIIKRKDPMACQILLPALQTVTTAYTSNDSAMLKVIVEYDSHECLSVLVPHFKRKMKVKSRKSHIVDLVRECLGHKSVLEVLMKHQLVPLETCLCEAVKEGRYMYMYYI